jgi:hypothetical protein
MLTSLYIAASLFGQNSTEAGVQKIIQTSKASNQVWQTLTELCTKIGARPTGSAPYQKAEKWGVAKFKAIGLSNPRLEKWGEVPVGFYHGPNMKGTFHLDGQATAISITSNCWTGGTNGAKRGHVVMAPKNMEEFEKVKSLLSGAWVLSSQAVTMRGPQTGTEDPALYKAIQESGCLGRVFGASMDRLHVHGSWQNKTFENQPKNVEVAIKRSDFDRIATSLVEGKSPVLELNVDHRWQKGPIAVHNVIAEIPGSVFPNEVVVVGGHLDSWDAPGSQGCSDNGTGVSSVIEAARLIKQSGLKPKRTIRFMLFGGEEQGLLGSRGYVEAHKLEMEKISACLVDDGGSNYENGASGYAIWEPFFKPVFEAMTLAFPTMPMKFNVQENYNGSGGSDQASFWQYGVPSFYMSKSGKQVYGEVWHTQYDRLDKAFPEYLVQASTSLATLSFAIANAETMIPRMQKSGS